MKSQENGQSSLKLKKNANSFTKSKRVNHNKRVLIQQPTASQKDIFGAATI